jgi:hypothetical protein
MKHTYDALRTKNELERLVDISVSTVLIEELEKSRLEGVYWAARRVCPGCAEHRARISVNYILRDGTIVDTLMHPADSPERAMTECLAAGFVRGPQNGVTWTS